MKTLRGRVQRGRQGRALPVFLTEPFKHGDRVPLLSRERRRWPSLSSPSPRPREADSPRPRVPGSLSRGRCYLSRGVSQSLGTGGDVTPTLETWAPWGHKS